MVYIMRNNIIDTCKINKNSYPQELWLKGAKPFGSRPLGKITGFAMVRSAIKKMYDPTTKSLIEMEKAKDVIFCTFGNGGLISKILGQYEVFAGIYPDDFANDLSAPQVFINDLGFGLSPQLFKMAWCAKHWQDKVLIDETAKETIHRYLIEDNLNELAEVIHKAIAVEPKVEDDKSIAERMGLDKKIPMKSE